jgi:hypothetical protein
MCKRRRGKAYGVLRHRAGAVDSGHGRALDRRTAFPNAVRLDGAYYCAGQLCCRCEMGYRYSRYSFAPFEGLLPGGRLFAHAPDRGDIVVFRWEGDTRDFVKRIVGMPGDRIQMIDGVLHINGGAVRHEPQGDAESLSVPTVREPLPNGVMLRRTRLDLKDACRRRPHPTFPPAASSSPVHWGV